MSASRQRLTVTPSTAAQGRAQGVLRRPRPTRLIRGAVAGCLLEALLAIAVGIVAVAAWTMAPLIVGTLRGAS